MKPHVFQFDQAKADAVDTTDAVRFLEALRHPGEPIWLQTFADGPDEQYVLDQKTAKSGRPYTVKRWKVAGIPKAGGKTGSVLGVAEKTGSITLEQLAERPYLLENMARAGVFVCINVLAEDAPRRKAEHIVRVAAVFLDLDGTPMPANLPLEPTATVESSAGRHHVYWAVDGVPLDEFPVIQKHLAHLYDADPAVHDLPRVMRLPGYLHGKDEPGQLVRLTSLQPDAQYTRDDLLQAFPGLTDALAAATAERERQAQDAERRREQADRIREQISTGTAGTLIEVQRKYGEVAMLGLTADLLSAGEGGRNNTLNAVAYRAGRLIGAGFLDEADVRAQLGDIAEQTGLERGETETTLSSGLEAGKANPIDASQVGKFLGVKAAKPSKAERAMTVARQKVEKAPVEAGSGKYVMPDLPRGTDEGTDEANALILAANNLADRLRYTFGIGWYVYHPQRGVWMQDDAKLTLASQVAGPVLRGTVGDHAARLLKRNARDEELEPVLKWRKEVGQNWAIRNALAAAAGKPEFLTQPDQWDARPELLNCRNGVLDLTTGTLLPHSPAHLLTWQAGAKFDPDAHHEYVDQLTDLLRRDGRHDFLQRSSGATLYGEAPNEVATVMSGEGGTGKGTLISAIMAMLGDYAGPFPIELLLANAHGESGGGPKPEVLDLRGKRLVVAGEPPKGGRFNAGKVKSLTGNDIISARAMRSDVIVKFKPVFKLWIHTNYPINTPHDDTGMQRRLRVVPFNAKPERPYAAFKSTLENDPTARSALLNWAFEGYRLWRDSGFDLGVSAEIEAATSGYWKEQNPYEKFAASRLVFGESYMITSARLKAMFEEWADENGAKMGRAVKMADLYAYLDRAHQCESGRSAGARVWFGVTELTEVDDTTDTTDSNSLVHQLHTRVSPVNWGNGVTAVSGVTRDDVATREPVAAGWVGDDL